MSREAKVHRKTSETDIAATIDLDGSGKTKVKTPIGFLTHMVEQLGRHSLIDIEVDAEGDAHIDGHHTTEDLGFVLGQAVSEALGDRAGIRRYGSATLPMDEVMITAAIDLSGRPYFVYRVPMPKTKLGDFETELAEIFFEAFVRGARCNLHMHLTTGDNLHHIIESAFKALARALRVAVELDPRSSGVPSTKGTLTA